MRGTHEWAATYASVAWDAQACSSQVGGEHRAAGSAGAEEEAHVEVGGQSLGEGVGLVR